MKLDEAFKIAEHTEPLEEGLDVKGLIKAELEKQGIPHRFDTGSKHAMAVYQVPGPDGRPVEASFPFSAHGKFDGKIRQSITSSLKRHIRFTQNGLDQRTGQPLAK